MNPKKLQKQFLELYRALSLLDSFGQLNCEATAKFLKKHDKNLGIKLKSDYMKRIENRGFVNRDILRLLISETEVCLFFLSYFHFSDFNFFKYK
jgi:SPX domain protein involved in polyphosphate accumulation